MEFAETQHGQRQTGNQGGDDVEGLVEALETLEDEGGAGVEVFGDRGYF
jgi:hypothetical protein